MDREQAIARGRAVQDITKMEGWTILKSQINEELAQATEDLRMIETQGRSLQDIGAEFVRLQQLINGLNRSLDIVAEIVEQMERELH